MYRIALGPLLLALAGCHGMLGQRTDKEETDLNNFAEARQRAATYYDGGDFERAAAQFKEALSFRPDNHAARMGLAYSLMAMNQQSSLLEAEKQFVEEIGPLSDPKREVKRAYGLGMTYRSLAANYDRRSRIRDQKGLIKGAAEDAAKAREYARQGLAELQRVIDLDQVIAQDQQISAFRVSASLTPDAHVAMAHCEILLMDHTKPDHVETHLQRAQEHLSQFATIAENARTFWVQRREKLLVTDPLKDNVPSARVTDPAEIKRYEERIANTLRQEIAVRRAMMETLLFVNRFELAIEEATKILQLDPEQDDILLLRGRAYAWLVPPNYGAALRDLKAYRARQPLDRLTDELVRLNKDIRDLETRQRSTVPGDPAAVGAD